MCGRGGRCGRRTINLVRNDKDHSWLVTACGLLTDFIRYECLHRADLGGNGNARAQTTTREVGLAMQWLLRELPRCTRASALPSCNENRGGRGMDMSPYLSAAAQHQTGVKKPGSLRARGLGRQGVR
jgi:hypothetical protein